VDRVADSVKGRSEHPLLTHARHSCRDDLLGHEGETMVSNIRVEYAAPVVDLAMRADAAYRSVGISVGTSGLRFCEAGTNPFT
jgi:hypothetical protein